MSESLHVGIFNPNTLYRENGQYTTDGSVLKLYQRWGDHFKQVYICSPVVTDRRRRSVEVGQKLDVVELYQWRNPWTLRTLELPLLLYDIWQAFDEHHQQWDFVVVSTPSVFGQAAYVVATAFDVPVVMYLRGNISNEILRRNDGVSRLVATAWVQYLDRAVDHMVRDGAVLTAGDELQREYEELAGSIKSIVPSLIESGDIVAPETRTYPSDDDPLRLLYLGRLVEYKRVQDVLAAMVELRPRSRAYELEVVGDGPYRVELERRADELGIASGVTFTGYVSHENVYDAYDRADVFVLPSSTEGSPKTVPEALARGCPTVASAVGNVPTLLADDTGITYEPGDIDTLVKSLDRLGTDEEYWLRLVERSVARASQFTAESHVQAIERVLLNTYSELYNS